jgi:hypothetical protein
MQLIEKNFLWQPNIPARKTYPELIAEIIHVGDVVHHFQARYQDSANNPIYKMQGISNTNTGNRFHQTFFR